MNVLGQPFESWVTEQIKVRQSSLGISTSIPTTDLLYQNAKAPWLRLASTVNINKTEENNGVFNRLLSFGLDGSLIQGDVAARNFILQGGTAKIIDENSGELNSGLNTINNLYNGAYGWGTIDERGYVPMPGILSANVQYYNNGALSKSSINVKCYSRNQLALLDALYMRPGYNLLLEFGWSQYLNNEGELETFDNFFTQPLSYIFNPTGISSDTATHFDVLDLIQKERFKRKGNYEGVFGKITNFNWSFNPDGSYDCRIDLTGMGDMMESLKVNIKLPSQKDENAGGGGADELVAEASELPPIIANKDKTTLNKTLFNLYQQTNKTESNTDWYYDLTIKSFPDVKTEVNSEGETSTTFKKIDLKIPNGMLALNKTTTDIEENSAPQVYITFGALLAYIQKYLLIYDKKGTPLFAFDVDFKNLVEDENYIVKIPGQFSANPLSCLIPYEGLPKGVADDVKLADTNINRTLLTKSEIFLTKYQYLGRLTGIYLNINNIAAILDGSPRSEDGSLSLLSFLNNIIQSFTQALGGINMISIKVDENTQRIKFIENSPQRFENADEPEGEFARINTFGVKPNEEGSFVRNLTMGGELGPKYASMIAIGSQISGNKLSANATGFSTYNAGLEDRVIPQKNNAEYDAGTEADAEKEVVLTIGDLWNKQINPGGEEKSLFNSIYNNRLFTVEDCRALQELNYNFINQVSGKCVEINQLQSPSFLPFNLAMDLDGISGLKLFEKFIIDDRILPPSIGSGNVDFLVKSLNHSIDSSQWMTQIDTQCAPIRKLDPIAKPTPLTAYVEGQNNAAGGGGAPVGNIGDVKSLTSGFPMAKIFYDGPTAKKQIVIHHTAGSTKSPSRTIAGWSKRTDHVATHYITNNLGDKEQLFADEAWANHLGVKGSQFRQFGVAYQNLNKTSLGIEMQAFGGLKKKDGKYFTYVNSEIEASRVAVPVDKNGNPTTYKGYSYYEKYNAANIQSVKEIVQGWMSKYGIPFVYDYDVLFPASPVKVAFEGTPGVYTHNSFRSGKSDVFPQKELIDMFKSIATKIV